MGLRSPYRRAFTLVEILIVVIILGILAAILIPQFGTATTDSRTSALRTNLSNIRNQIEIFKAQHNSIPPDTTCLWTLLTTGSDTDEFASASPIGTKFGPYVVSVPTNPINGKSNYSSATADTNAGWYYLPTGQQFQFYARNLDGSINITY